MGLLEMHGTGTPLGDPIEINAALAVLMPGGGKAGVGVGPAPGGSVRPPLALTAVKSEMGHAEPAAGVMGLIRLKAQVGKGVG
jgi:acyl transferase domain-containing protein